MAVFLLACCGTNKPHDDRCDLSEGITENTSKKKQQLRERQGREAAAKDFEAKKRAAAGLAPEEAAEVLSGDPERPFSRGRAYSSEHYTKHEENE